MVRLPIGSETIWISPLLQHRTRHGRRVVDYVICPTCGISVGRDTSRRNHGQRFCSHACHGAHISRRVERQCQQCGVSFEAPRSRVERGWASFCSNKCKGQYQRDNAELLYHSREHANCKECGKAFYYYPRPDDSHRGYFCSRACSAAFYEGKAKRSQGSRSGCRGVYLGGGKAKKWVVQIRYLNQSHYFGSYDDPETAARVYDREAKRLHGEDAILNFPDLKDDEGELE